MANLFTSINTICNRRESLGTVVYKLSILAVWFWAGSFITALHSTLSVSAAPESTTMCSVLAGKETTLHITGRQSFVFIRQIKWQIWPLLIEKVYD